MIKLKVVWVGKTQEGFPKEGVQEFEQKLKHMCSIEIRTVEVKGKISDEGKLKTEEWKKIEAEIGEKDLVILLDERGKQLDSIQFAKQLEQWSGSGKVPTFVIGGAYGFVEDAREKYSNWIALSKMVMTHQLIRVVLLEQIYRALNIQKGTGYHK